MFEPVVAVASFFVWVHGFLVVDRHAASGIAPGLRKYQITPKRQLNKPMEGDSKQILSRWYSGWVWEMAV